MRVFFLALLVLPFVQAVAAGDGILIKLKLKNGTQVSALIANVSHIAGFPGADILSSTVVDDVNTLSNTTDSGGGSSSDGLSTGAIIGIVAGSVGGVLLLAGVFYFISRKKEDRQESPESSESEELLPKKKTDSAGRGMKSCLDTGRVIRVDLVRFVNERDRWHG